MRGKYGGTGDRFGDSCGLRQFCPGKVAQFSPDLSARFLSPSTKELVTGLVICVDLANLPWVGGRVANQITIFTKLVSKIPQPW